MRLTHSISCALLSLCPAVLAAAPIPAGEPAPKLGIGFLWTAQSEKMIAKVTTEADFVDVILGPGKVDVFEKVKPPVRVACIARSLEKDPSRPFPGVKETIETLGNAGIPPARVIIAYNSEGQPGTPSDELRELVESSRKAKQHTEAYGAPLLVGPGLRDKEGREALYSELAKVCDIWMIQSQRLQLEQSTRKPVPVALYREKVKEITDALRRGKPNIRIFVQLVTTTERGSIVLSAGEVVAFALH